MAGITLLRIKGGKRSGEPIRLEGTQFTFGRSKECDLRLSSDAASRKHAVIRHKGDAWFVEDLGSSNGTYLNGKKISSGALRPSDVVKFGEAGAKVQIVAMDPMPATDASGDEETRYLRVSGSDSEPRLADPVRQKQPARQAPPPAAAAQYDAQAKPKKKAAAWTWIFPLLGIAAGILTCEGFWTKTLEIQDFPYSYVMAPYWLVMRGLFELDVVPSGDIMKYLPHIVLGLWFGLLGLLLRRPWKARFFIIFWLIIHGVAIAMLPDQLK